MNTVELFSGTGSFSKVAKEHGNSIFRVELNKKFEAELHKDILDLQREDLPKKIDVLWASPPCTTFSVASIRHYWSRGRPKNAKTWHGISMIQKTLQLIEEIKQDNPSLIWFIENPRGMLRKQDFMKNLPRKTITYCQYGLHYQKATDIWTNLNFWSPKPMCKPKSPCHVRAGRGSKTGVQGLKYRGNHPDWSYEVGRSSVARAIVPPLLFQEIFGVIKRGVLRK